MDAIDAIRSRRMLPKAGVERPTRAEIEELIELAVRAPSHHLTEPWRFVVLAGDERNRLARAIADDAIEHGADPSEARADAAKKVDRAPVIIAVTCIPSDRDDVIEREEFASVAMAMQNMLLAAHAKGLAAMLRTGPAAYGPSVRTHLELAPNEHVAGFVYLGIPAGERALTPRAPAAEHTRWLGWDR